MAQALFTEFKTNEDIVETSIGDLTAFINSKSREHITVPQRTDEPLKKAARYFPMSNLVIFNCQ
ncbi:MAG: hypothetical protein IJ583_06505 [Firmicutes bacterium]|nr:hypothetical protein [Bacillota bacterium]